MAISHYFHIVQDEHPKVSVSKCSDAHTLTITDDNGNDTTVFATKLQLEIMRESIDSYLKSFEEPCAE